MDYLHDIQNVNLSAWKLPTNEPGKTSTPIIITEILLAQFTFLLSTNYQDFSNQNITCSKEKNRCLIISPNVAEELFWDPREQCFGSTMRNDIITSVTSNNTGFRRGQTRSLSYRVCPCLLYTSPSPRDQRGSRMPSSA